MGPGIGRVIILNLHLSFFVTNKPCLQSFKSVSFSKRLHKAAVC